MKKSKLSFRLMVKRANKYLLAVAIIVCCCAFDRSVMYGDQIFPYPPEGQGHMTTWCVFACEAAVFQEFNMCEYATIYARLINDLPGTSDCCYAGQNPSIYPDPNYPIQCLLGVNRFWLNFIFNESSNQGTILYHGLSSSVSSKTLGNMVFPCFGIRENTNNHCLVVCGIWRSSSIYGTVCIIYYWDPWGAGSYKNITFSSNEGYDDTDLWSSLNNF